MQTVPLCGPSAAGRVALVDDEDYSLISPYRWNAREYRTKTGLIIYAYAQWGGRRNRSHAFMHNLIMGRVGIDHRDHDGLNNQRANLRIAGQSRNLANARRRGDNTSGFKGVSWYRPNKKWRAYVNTAGKQRHLGYFTCKEDAARAYDAAATAIYGEFACLNFPQGD